MEKGLKRGTMIAIAIVIFGMLLVGYCAFQISECEEKIPDDARTHKNIQDYGENGTLTHTNTSIVVVEGTGVDSNNAWSRPFLGIYTLILLMGIILIIAFGILAIWVACQ